MAAAVGAIVESWRGRAVERAVRFVDGAEIGEGPNVLGILRRHTGRAPHGVAPVGLDAPDCEHESSCRVAPVGTDRWCVIHRRSRDELAGRNLREESEGVDVLGSRDSEVSVVERRDLGLFVAFSESHRTSAITFAVVRIWSPAPATSRVWVGAIGGSDENAGVDVIIVSFDRSRQRTVRRSGC